MKYNSKKFHNRIVSELSIKNNNTIKKEARINTSYDQAKSYGYPRDRNNLYVEQNASATEV